MLRPMVAPRLMVVAPQPMTAPLLVPIDVGAGCCWWRQNKIK
jgi:hypothetical protein